MTLTMAKAGEINIIKKIGGKEEVRHFLYNLGFVEGTMISVITSSGGNVIVDIKGSRVAISREMALKIIV